VARVARAARAARAAREAREARAVRTVGLEARIAHQRDFDGLEHQIPIVVDQFHHFAVVVPRVQYG